MVYSYPAPLGNEHHQSLIQAIQDLARCHTTQAVVDLVRVKARALLGADGATFVLEDEAECYYVDEDAIGPLFKGRRFPIDSCVSGWCMKHAEPVVIEDIRQDSRVPLEAYEATFVRSLAMVPMSSSMPFGAVGCYWAKNHRASPNEVETLQSLADSASLALKNVALTISFEECLAEQTKELRHLNRELDGFVGAVAHELRSSLQCISLQSELLMEVVPPEEQEQVTELQASVQSMGQKLKDLLRLSRATAAQVSFAPVDLSGLVSKILESYRKLQPDRKAEVTIEEGLVVEGDDHLLELALDNLLSNAWKYSSRRELTKIKVYRAQTERGAAIVFQDNGAGFDPKNSQSLFLPFGRLHRQDEFPGTGLGLVIVSRIVHKHGGQIWAESRLGEGTKFFLQLGDPAALEPASPRSSDPRELARRAATLIVQQRR